LTTSGYCNGLWGGVQVNGETFLPQEYQHQGKVIVYGTIKNAWYGIRTFMPGYCPEGGGVLIEEGYPSGGIIHVSGGKFVNNKTAIRFYPYRGNGDNISYLSNAVFTTNASLEGNYHPDCFVRMDGVSGIEISKCTFQNLRPKNECQFGQRGKGIVAFNADVNISQNISSDSTYFKSLDYGIYALNGATTPAFLISQCAFHNNRKSVYLSGYTAIDLVDIKNNTFWLNNNSMVSQPLN